MPRATVFPIASVLTGLAALGLVVYIVVSNRSAVRRLPELGSATWAALQTGLPRALEDDPALVRYTRHARRWRVAGVLAGWWALPVAWVAVTELRPPITPLGGFEYAIAGWFVGGLVHDLFSRHRTSSPVRVAQLTARSPLRYVTATARRWLLASYALTAVAAALAIAARDRVSWRRDALAAAGTMALFAVGALAVWRIATRPHPAGDASDVQVDEAIRTLATIRTVSAWTALQFGLAAAFVPSPLRAGWFEPATVVVWLAFVGVVGAWAWVPTRVPARPPATRSTVAA